MKFVLVCFLALVASVLAETNQPVPILLHANANTFSHSSSSDVMSTDQFTSLLQDIVTPRTSSLVNGVTAPEVLLAVVYDELDFATLAREMGSYGPASASPLSEIKPLMSSATSSLTIPYAHPAPFYRSTSNHILSTFSSTLPSSQFTVLGDAGFTTCDDMITHLTQSTHLFSNGVTDLIILSIPTTSTCAKQVMDVITQHTSSVVVMYTAQQSKHQIHTTWDVTPVSAVAYQTKAVGAVGADVPGYIKHNLHYTTGPTRLTPNILIGILVMFFLLFILYMGVTCLMAVERPVRMSSTVLQISKEY